MNKIRFNVVLGILALLFAAILVRVYNLMIPPHQPIITTVTETTTASVIQSDIIPAEEFIDHFTESELHCLSLAIYGEARGETADGMKAVAFVIMNRVANRRFPNTVCEVVLQPFQFEALSPSSPLHDMAQLALDGEMTFPDMNNKWIKNKIHEIAHKVYHGRLDDITHGAKYFYAPKVQTALGRRHPSWTGDMTLTRQIGGHNFYAPCCAE